MIHPLFLGELGVFEVVSIVFPRDACFVDIDLVPDCPINQAIQCEVICRFKILFFLMINPEKFLNH